MDNQRHQPPGLGELVVALLTASLTELAKRLEQDGFPGEAELVHRLAAEAEAWLIEGRRP